MGQVIAARHDGFFDAELVALKRIAPRFAVDEGAVAALLDEARAASRVSHPNVVSVRDIGHDQDGSPYLVMDLIVGSDLARVLRQRGRLPICAALEWMAQLAEGLQAVHDATNDRGEPLGLVHRDVSPHNVLIGTDGIARLSDFGIALSNERLQAATRSGTIKGKIRYMSPEQVRAEKLTAKSDVFSLGVVAWESLTGAPLFDAAEPSRTLERMRTLDIPAPSSLRADVPEAASRAVLLALSRDPGDRPSARELSDALRSSGPRAPIAELAAVVVPVALSGIRDIRSSLEDTWSAAAKQIAVDAPHDRIRALRPGRIALLVGLCVAALALVTWVVRST